MGFPEEKQRECWLSAMRMDMMASEQSGEEGDEPVVLIKLLLWRGEQVNKLFKQLDQKIAAEHSPQARHQLMHRVFQVNLPLVQLL